MKKILFIATIAEHFYYFHLPYFEMFKKAGWQVDVASHGDVELPFCDNRYEIPIQRSPFDKRNFSAYKKLKRIINENNYDIVHCHTPMGGLLGRLAAAKQRKNGTKVMYTAHGFHFCTGAPPVNWLVYFPIEYVMSFFTDCLITINDEDFFRAKKFFKIKIIKKVDGVGYNCEKYFPVSVEEKEKLRKKYGYKSDEKILIYVAELNKNKNQKMLILMLKELLKTNENVRLVLAGADNINGYYQKFAKETGVYEKIDFKGHCENIDDLLHISDIAVASSIREGLPVNVMEALGCGLPAVLSNNRGHRVLVKDNYNGFVVKADDYISMANKIQEIICSEKKYKIFSENAISSAERFSAKTVVPEMHRIYKEINAV